MRNQREWSSRHKQERIRAGGDRVRLTVQGMVMVAGATLLFLLYDGMRREGEERGMRVVATQPGVTYMRKGMSYSSAPGTNQAMVEGDTLTTDQAGSATIQFHEGSAMKMAPSSGITIRLLDYRRNDARDRHIRLDQGAVLVRLSKNFAAPTGGGTSQFGIATGSAFVTATQAASFRVANTSGGVVVDVLEGVVTVRTAGGATQIGRGGRGVAGGNAPPTRDAGDGAVLAQMRKTSAGLASYDGAPNTVVNSGRGVMRFVDPLFRWIGLNPGTFFDFRESDTARLAAAKMELLNLRKAWAGAGEMPAVMPPTQVEPAGLTSEQQERIMRTFKGLAIDSYQKQGSNGYILRVHARDTKSTPLVLTPNGIKEGK